MHNHNMKKLVEKRLKYGISQNALAKAIGKDHNWLSKRERGEIRCTDEEYAQIEVALHNLNESKLLNTAIHEMLRKLRTMKGLEQAQVAEKMGLDQTAVSRIENGKGKLTLQALEAYCAAIGLEMSLQILIQTGEFSLNFRRIKS